MLDHLHREILTLSSEDELGLWFAMTPVEKAFPDASPDVIRIKVMEILHDLLKCELILAGFPYLDGTEIKFSTWELSPGETIQRINKEWDTLGREPAIGDVVWFVATEKGERVIKEWKKG